MYRLLGSVETAWRFLLESLFPLVCVECGAARELLCIPCRAAIPLIPPVTADTYAAHSYKNRAIRRLIWRLKYKDDAAAPAVLADLLRERLSEELAELTLRGFIKPLVVATPSSGSHWFRNGRHAERIAEAFTACHEPGTMAYVPRALEKRWRTEPQTKLNRKERVKNLKNAFVARADHSWLGKNVIIIDDVTTTGATFAEARRALLDAGAKRVICAAVAH